MANLLDENELSGNKCILEENEPSGNENVTSVDGENDEVFDDKCVPQLKRISCPTWAVAMTELCERYSYYGIKAGLVLYLTQSLLMPRAKGKAWYHGFSMLSYFTGVIGAIMADSWLGKFKTCVYSLIVYSLSVILLTLTSVPDIGQRSSIGPLFSLLAIAIACGNIKPCLGAFGGDQVNKKDVKLVATFFSIFYMAVNVGATFAMVFAPMLRTDIQCYGADCYTAVFVASAVVIVMSVLFFLSGKNGYIKREPEGNMIIKVSKIIFHALRERRRHKGNIKKSWLYYADNRYRKREIDDVHGLLRVVVMFIPLPLWWALFSQQGSSWTLQAEQMDGSLGSTELRSDQIQFFNPVLVLILIPLFDVVMYPSLEKCGIKLTSLKKMVGGMILAAIAFAITGFVQIKIEDVQPNPSLLPNLPTLDFINVSPCQLLQVQSGQFSLLLPYGKHSGYQVIHSAINNIVVKGTNCFSKSDNYTSELNVTVNAQSYQSILFDINDKGAFLVNVLEQKFPSVNLKTADTRVRAIYVPGFNLSSEVLLRYKHPLFDQRSKEIGNFTGYNGTVQFMQASRYSIEIQDLSGNEVIVKNSEVKFKTFGEYTVTLKRPMHQQFSKEIVADVYEDVKGTSVHRSWQLPQYIVITAGEIMFSVTGLEFSYSQAPQSMKSVLQSLWMLTVAFGDLIVVILSVAKPVDGVVEEMFLYGGIMVAIAIIFSIMSHFYIYNDFSGRNVLVSDYGEAGNEREDGYAHSEISVL